VESVRRRCKEDFSQVYILHAEGMTIQEKTVMAVEARRVKVHSGWNGKPPLSEKPKKSSRAENY